MPSRGQYGSIAEYIAPRARRRAYRGSRAMKTNSIERQQPSLSLVGDGHLWDGHAIALSRGRMAKEQGRGRSPLARANPPRQSVPGGPESVQTQGSSGGGRGAGGAGPGRGGRRGGAGRNPGG